MKLVGIRDGLRTVIGRQFDDGIVAPLAEVTDFYADLAAWTAAAAALTERVTGPAPRSPRRPRCRRPRGCCASA